MSQLNLNYFIAKLYKDGKITVPEEVRELYKLQAGESYIFMYYKPVKEVKE